MWPVSRESLSEVWAANLVSSRRRPMRLATRASPHTACLDGTCPAAGPWFAPPTPSRSRRPVAPRGPLATRAAICIRVGSARARPSLSQMAPCFFGRRRKRPLRYDMLSGFDACVRAPEPRERLLLQRTDTGGTSGLDRAGGPAATRRPRPLRLRSRTLAPSAPFSVCELTPHLVPSAWRPFTAPCLLTAAVPLAPGRRPQRSAAARGAFARTAMLKSLPPQRTRRNAARPQATSEASGPWPPGPASPIQ